MKRVQVSRRQQWIAMLAKLVAPMDEERAGKAMANYLPMMTKFPDDVFCPECLAQVSNGLHRVPTFGELVGLMQVWWEDEQFRRKSAAGPRVMPPGEEAGLSDEDLQHLASWHRLRPERLANGGLAVALSVQRQRPELFRHICRTDAEAARIARGRGWLLEAPQTIEQRMQADWGSITPEGLAAKLVALDQLRRTSAVGATMAAGWLSFLRSAIEKYAPHHLPLMPERFGPEERQP